MSNSSVTISKSIAIGEVPAEIRTMVDKVQKELCYTIPDIMKTIQMKVFSNNGDDFFKTIEILEYLRAELNKIDTNIEECTNILTGYKEIMMSGATPAQEEQPTTDSDEVEDE
mgnify:FL=1|tara:strand:- start:69 stop:407 length:339 start_codon:yes stop_codon:yes gene_type:complete